MKTIITYHKYLNLSQKERDKFTGIIESNFANIVGLTYIKNGLLHREDGPAKTYSDGSESWCFKGKLHRIGGPAFINKLNNIEQYWIHGQQCTKEAHDFWIDLVRLKELNYA